jgi:hypothetical protein
VPRRRYDLVAFDVDGTLVRDGRGRTAWEVLNERYTGRSDVKFYRLDEYRDVLILYRFWFAV